MGPMPGDGRGPGPATGPERPAAARSILRLRICGDPQGVRAGLATATAALAAAGVDAADAGIAETVLAEVLNNIVEHAYPAGPGPIGLRLVRCDATGAIEVTTLDLGAAMPGLTLPRGDPPRVELPVESLPEGGFGWFLIRHLAHGLAYRRRGHCNRLRFRLGGEATAGG